MRKKVYRLYAAVYEPGMEDRLERFPFCRYNASDGFVLIYSDRKPGKEFVWYEIREKESEKLNDAERKWLVECNVSILKAETKRQSAEILRDLSLKVGALEEALRQEAEKESADAKP